MNAPPPLLPDALGAALLRAADAAPPARAEAGAAAAEAIAGALGREVTGLLLFGSRARGEATSTSDVDAVVFAEVDARGGLRGVSAGVDLDIEVLPAAGIAELAPGDWIHLVPGVTLHDPGGALAAFLARVEERRARGPAPMTPAELDRARMWTRRMCARIRRSIEAEPALAEIHGARLASELVEMYFQLRGRWTCSAQQALRYWTAHDPEVRQRWDALAEARDPRTRLAALERLAAAIIDG